MNIIKIRYKCGKYLFSKIYRTFRKVFLKPTIKCEISNNEIHKKMTYSGSCHFFPYSNKRLTLLDNVLCKQKPSNFEMFNLISRSL